jgi:hypothetical protein
VRGGPNPSVDEPLAILLAISLGHEHVERTCVTGCRSWHGPLDPGFSSSPQNSESQVSPDPRAERRQSLDLSDAGVRQSVSRRSACKRATGLTTETVAMRSRVVSELGYSIRGESLASRCSRASHNAVVEVAAALSPSASPP